MSGKLLPDQLQLFTHACWGPARYKFFNEKPPLPSGYEPGDIDWPGSRFFLDTHGYYGVHNINLAVRAPEPIPGFPFDPRRDTEYDTVRYPPPPWGRPDCKSWWEDPTYGLRARLIQEIDPDAWAQTRGWVAQHLAGEGWDPRKTEDAALRAMWSVEQEKLSLPVTGGPGNAPEAVSSRISRWAAVVGGVTESAGFAGKLYAIWEAAPVIQSLLLMVIYGLMPFVLLFSGFSLGTILTLTITLFAVRFWTFLWALAVWVDNTLTEALNPAGALMFAVVPLFWLAMLGWSGIAVGNGVNSFLETKSDTVGQTGQAGANTILGALRGGVLRRR